MTTHFNFENHMPYDGWYCDTYDYIKTVGEMLGFDIKEIYFSGFWNQGDGAQFIGDIGYAKGASKNVRKEFPQDTTLHEIADSWTAVQKEQFYGLRGKVIHYGHYYHENCNLFDFWHEEGRELSQNFCEDSAKEVVRSFMKWMYEKLQREYEFQQADVLAYAYTEKINELSEVTHLARSLVTELRQQRNSGTQVGETSCTALQEKLAEYREEVVNLRQYRDDIEYHFHYWEDGKAVTIHQFIASYIN